MTSATVSVFSRATTAPARQPVENARGLAAMLLAAAVSALAVVADQLIDTWADGHLMLAWIALWSVVFIGSLLLTGTASRVGQKLMSALNRWARSQAQARADARLLAMARFDPRIMADLRTAADTQGGVLLAAPRHRTVDLPFHI